MKLIRHRLAAALLCSGIAACCSASASAFAAGQPDAPPAAGKTAMAAPAETGQGDGAPGGPHAFGGPGPGMPGPEMPFDAGPGMRGMHGAHDGLMGHLHGLHLSEAQQDKLFAIHHAAQPEQREHMKAIRKAHEGLAELARAERFDDARAAALSRELGQAIAADALLQARTEAQALAVLSPEQREGLRRRRLAGPHARD